MKTNGIHNAFLILLILLSASVPVTLIGQIQGKNDTIILDRVLAVVGNKPVLQYDLEAEYIQALQSGYQIKDGLKCKIFEDILVRKLMVIQAEIDSLEVTDEDVNRLLESKLQYQILQVGSQENLEKMFNKSLLEIKKDLFASQKEQRLVELMQNKITEGVKVTPAEVQSFFKKIPAAEIPLREETVEIQQIAIKPQISEAERTRILNRLNELRKRIKNGESMTTLAVLYSEDAGTATRGGEVGLAPRNGLAPEYAAVAFNLLGNEVSRPVKTDFGYHIIQTIERRGDLINTRHILMKPHPDPAEKQRVNKLLDSIAQGIRESKISFEEAVRLYSQDDKTKNNQGIVVFHDPNGGKNHARIQISQLSEELRSIVGKLKVGEISDPYESTDDKGNMVYKIVKVKARIPSHKIDLKTDYEFIQDMALEDKKNKVVNDWIDKKITTTYHRINPDYGGCPFQHKGWVIK